MITDKEIYQTADDEKQQDWDDKAYEAIYKDGFIDGAKWARAKAGQVEPVVKVTEPTFTKTLVLEFVRKEITESYKSEMSKTDFDNKLYTILGIINCALQ